MGLLFVLLAVWFIVLIVGFIIEQKYKAELQALIDELEELKAQMPQKEKYYKTNFQGQNENETFTWNVENKK